MPDAVVIGAGPNGLVAANLLADRGWDVLVCEAAPEPGGAVRSAELIEPGFVNDMFSAFYPLAAASPVDREPATSSSYGLRWRRAPLVLAHPAPDGTCPVLSTDLDETAASLDAFHPGDGDAWRATVRSAGERIRGGLLDGLFTPIPPITATARARARARARRAAPLRALRAAVRAAARRGGVRVGRGAAAASPASALHADLSPDDVLSGFFGWVLCSLGQDVGWPVPEGGAGRLADALVDRLRAKGGRIECDAPVDKVIVRDGRAVAVRVPRRRDRRAARACSPTSTRPGCSSSWSAPNTCSARVVDDLRRFAWDHSVFKVDWTSTRPCRGPRPTRAGRARCTSSRASTR